MRRFYLILAKLVVVLIAVMIFYGTVMLSLVIGDIMMRIMLPDGLVISGNVRGVLENAEFIGLGFSFPMSPVHLIYHLLFVTVGFSTITVWIMLDRSKKGWGFAAGMVYASHVSSVWFILLTMFLFYDERIFADWGFVIISNLLNLLLSWWLINNKVSV